MNATTVDSLAGQKILITGARGFLGSHLSLRLLKAGAEVYGVSRKPPDDPENKIHWHAGDFADFSGARTVISEIKPDVIYHLAGLVTALPDRNLVLPTMNSLLVSTINTLVAAADVDCRRIVLAASLLEPSADSVEPSPSSPYAAAKWAGTVYARMFHKLYGTPVVVLRPFMTYGPMQDTRKLIPYVIGSLLRRETPKLTSGEWRADWIYVDDVIEAFLAAACVSDIEGTALDIGSGKLVSTRAVVQQLVDLSNTGIEPVFGAVAERPSEEVRVADIAVTHAKMGWSPKTSLRDGLQMTINWYKEQLRGPALSASIP